MSEFKRDIVLELEINTIKPVVREPVYGFDFRAAAYAIFFDRWLAEQADTPAVVPAKEG